MSRPEHESSHVPAVSKSTATPIAPSEAEEKALEQFGAWFDGELEQLVARWIHLAAPNASKRNFGRRM
jgi:hypothetical protein